MILKTSPKTTAYRCPSCGAGVMGLVGRFNLSNSMLKLKCSCKNSEMTLRTERDSKITIEAPCIFCPTGHKYTLSSTSFFERDFFVLGCHYTDFPTVIIGDEDKVKSELDSSFNDLLQKFPEVVDFLNKQKDNSSALTKEEQELSDAELISELVNTMADRGLVLCRCKENDIPKYSAVVKDGIYSVFCKTCGAKKVGEPRNTEEIQDFIGLNSEFLELF